jgi:hypothetical protein
VEEVDRVVAEADGGRRARVLVAAGVPVVAVLVVLAGAHRLLVGDVRLLALARGVMAEHEDQLVAAGGGGERPAQPPELGIVDVALRGHRGESALGDGVHDHVADPRLG